MAGGLNSMFWSLCAVGALAAVVYGLLFLNAPESLGRAALKTVMMAALAAAFASIGAPWVVVVAMVAAAVGDFALAFDRPAILPLGILAFLICQLAYFYIFFTHFAFNGAPTLPRYAAIVAILLVAIAFLIWMGPKLGAMTIPVIVYSIAICAMACSAFLLPWRGWPAMAGVVSFLISDFVLSAELFRLPPDSPARRITTPIVWWTYAAAQLLIAWGLVRVLDLVV